MEKAGVRDIEGLAMVGRVRRFWTERVDKKRFRLCVELVDARVLCTPSLNEKQLNLVMECVRLYTRAKLVE